jgi:hypothetical protein
VNAAELAVLRGLVPQQPDLRGLDTNGKAIVFQDFADEVFLKVPCTEGAECDGGEPPYTCVAHAFALYGFEPELDDEDEPEEEPFQHLATCREKDLCCYCPPMSERRDLAEEQALRDEYLCQQQDEREDR